MGGSAQGNCDPREGQQPFRPNTNRVRDHTIKLRRLLIGAVTSSIIPIHKMKKPLDSPAFFWPISLTSCVSKLFERIMLSHLFFLESNSILSPRQGGFRPGRSTLDQILFLSQSISDGFNKSRQGSETILFTIGFSKAFDSVWHPALFHKLILAGLPPYFDCGTQSFLSHRRACVVYQNHKSPSRCSARIRFWPCTFLSFHQ